MTQRTDEEFEAYTDEYLENYLKEHPLVSPVQKCIKCGQPAYQRNGKTYQLCAVCGWKAINELLEIEPLPDSEVAEIEREYQEALKAGLFEPLQGEPPEWFKELTGQAESPKRDIDHYHRFRCPKEDCDNRPFTITTDQLADADGWIACDVCGGKCEELPL